MYLDISPLSDIQFVGSFPHSTRCVFLLWVLLRCRGHLFLSGSCCLPYENRAGRTKYQARGPAAVERRSTYWKFLGAAPSLQTVTISSLGIISRNETALDYESQDFWEGGIPNGAGNEISSSLLEGPVCAQHLLLPGPTPPLPSQCVPLSSDWTHGILTAFSPLWWGRFFFFF